MTSTSEKLKHGATLAKQGKYPEAQAVFDEILGAHADEVEALFMKGACLYKQGDPAEASECWKQVLEVDPNHEKARNMLNKVSVSTPEPTVGVPGAPASQEKAESAEKKSPRKRSRKPPLNYKAIAAAVVILAIGGFAADMYFHPGSYPFLSGRADQKESGEPPSQPQQAAAPRKVPLEEGLSGKWFFLFQGSPATFNFYPNGRLNVVIKREGGITFQMDGTYQVEGSNIIFEVNTPEGPQNVTAYNAKISGPNFTFNYDSPDGPEIRAERR